MLPTETVHRHGGRMVEPGNLAWVFVAAALVLFMTPGLAFFYGGMVRAKNVLNMLMMNFWCVLVVPILWVVIGYSLSFSGTGSYLGDTGRAMLHGLTVLTGTGQTELSAMIFLCTFAAITPALISGAVADRMKFAAWAIFVPLWSIAVYSPVTFWVAAPTGWLKERGALDFAGGTSIHVNAGIAALAVILVLGRRSGWPAEGSPPHSMPLVMLGTGILWFGWFGFNAGSALGADGHALQAFISTFLAASAGGLAWAVTERIREGHFTNLGVASGIVAGLVAITPACAYVTPGSAIGIGVAAGIICSLAISVKFRFKFDDALDVVGVHFVGGLVGSLLIGVFSDPRATGWKVGQGNGLASKGLIAGGGWSLMSEQALANGVTMVYSFVVTFIIIKALDLLMTARVSPDVESEGLDITQHAETAYHHAERAMGRLN